MFDLGHNCLFVVCLLPTDMSAAGECLPTCRLSTLSYKLHVACPRQLQHEYGRHPSRNQFRERCDQSYTPDVGEVVNLVRWASLAPVFFPCFHFYLVPGTCYGHRDRDEWPIFNFLQNVHQLSRRSSYILLHTWRAPLFRTTFLRHRSTVFPSSNLSDLPHTKNTYI